MPATLTADTHAATSRIRGEYAEMPGLRLTTAQAARLWHLAPADCDELLGELVLTGFLTRTRSGHYMRRDGGIGAMS